MPHGGKPGGPDVKLRSPQAAGTNSLSHHQSHSASTPSGSGKPGGASVTPTKQRKGKTSFYGASACKTPGRGGHPGGRYC